MNQENPIPFRFLFVDDSPADNKYVSLLIKIKKLPIDAHFESRPHEALEYLKKCPKNLFPKVIMVDINMPLMNGFEFVEAYLNHFKQKGDTQLFITSSSVKLSDREEVEKHPHLVDFIEKPFNLQQFQNKILPVIR